MGGGLRGISGPDAEMESEAECVVKTETQFQYRPRGQSFSIVYISIPHSSGQIFSLRFSLSQSITTLVN